MDNSSSIMTKKSKNLNNDNNLDKLNLKCDLEEIGENLLSIDEINLNNENCKSYILIYFSIN
jgi:hypothetical protein